MPSFTESRGFPILFLILSLKSLAFPSKLSIAPRTLSKAPGQSILTLPIVFSVTSLTFSENFPTASLALPKKSLTPSITFFKFSYLSKSIFLAASVNPVTSSNILETKVPIGDVIFNTHPPILNNILNTLATINRAAPNTFATQYHRLMCVINLL